jgi:hypothetical protein
MRYRSTKRSRNSSAVIIWTAQIGIILPVPRLVFECATRMLHQLAVAAAEKFDGLNVAQPKWQMNFLVGRLCMIQPFFAVVAHARHKGVSF